MWNFFEPGLNEQLADLDTDAETSERIVGVIAERANLITAWLQRPELVLPSIPRLERFDTGLSPKRSAES